MGGEPLSVVWRDEPESSEEYETQRRRVYTLRVPDRFPLAIARPRIVSQVVSAVKLAIEKGHACGNPLWWAQLGMLEPPAGQRAHRFVEFKHLNHDEATDILEASRGTIGTELVEYLQPKGRFLPSGHCATVALGGFLLQGGMGLNARVRLFTYGSPYGPY